MTSSQTATSKGRPLCPAVLAVMVFLAAALIAATLIWHLERQRQQEARARAAILAQDHAHALQSNIERILSATYALAAMVRQGNGHFDNFEEVARQMLLLYPGADSLQLAPGGITRRIVPLAGNEKGIGRDLLKDPVRDKEARLARDSRKLTLAGPFELVQGGVGAVGRFPVFLGEEGGPQSFWGFATVVIRFPELLGTVRLPQLTERGFGYELWRIHPDTGKKQVIAASAAAFPLTAPLEYPVQVPNGTWTLSLAPGQGWGDPPGLVLKGALGLLFSLLLAWLTKLLVESRAHEAGLEALVATRTAEIGEAEERLRLLEDNLPDSYVYQYLLEPDGTPRFTHLSAGVERVHGVDLRDALRDAGTLHRQIDPAQWPVLAEAERASLGNLTDFRMELRICRSDGVWRWLLLRSRPYRRPDGQVVWDGMATDVTERIQAEQALRESEQRFRVVANASPALFWTSGLDKGCDWFNQTWLDFTGRGMEQELGNGWAEGVYPDDFARCLAIYGGAFDARQPFSMEYRLRRHDGAYRWLIDQGLPRYDASGAFVGFIGSCLDISEEKRLREQVVQSEAHYRRLFEHNPAPMLIYERGSLLLADVNEAFQRHYGYRREEALALRLPDLYPREEKAAITALVEQLHGPAFLGEWHHRKKNGEYINIVAHSHDLQYEGRDCRVAVITDITALHQAGEALRQRNAELERFNDASVGRELKMVELKREINVLSGQLGRPPPYDLGFTEDAGPGEGSLPA